MAKKKWEVGKQITESTRDRTIAWTGTWRKPKPKKRVAKKHNEHRQRRPATGQREQSFNYPTVENSAWGAAFQKTIAKTIRDAQRKNR